MSAQGSIPDWVQLIRNSMGGSLVEWNDGVGGWVHATISIQWNAYSGCGESPGRPLGRFTKDPGCTPQLERGGSDFGRQATTVMVIVAIVAAIVIGFLAGLLSFRVKSRWCPTCGTSTYADRQDHG